MHSKERHELKQDEFSSTVWTWADRLASNRSTVVTVAVVAVVVFLVIGGVMAWRARQANEAGALLGVAMATAQSQIAPASAVAGGGQTPGTFPSEQARAEAALAAFNQVVEQYPGTEPARLASYYAASELLAAGRFEEAAAAYGAIAEEEGGSLRGQSARLGQAEALRALDRTDEALKIFADLAAVRDGAMPADALLMQLARASARAGRTEEARAAYQRVIDEFPESLYLPDAEQQLAALN